MTEYTTTDTKKTTKSLFHKILIYVFSVLLVAVALVSFIYVSSKMFYEQNEINQIIFFNTYQCNKTVNETLTLEHDSSLFLNNYFSCDYKHQIINPLHLIQELRSILPKISMINSDPIPKAYATLRISNQQDLYTILFYVKTKIIYIYEIDFMRRTNDLYIELTEYNLPPPKVIMNNTSKPRRLAGGNAGIVSTYYLKTLFQVLGTVSGSGYARLQEIANALG